jgi:diguanylate cyclase (GGDEF)-like protein
VRCAPGGLCERVARTGVPAVVQPFDGPLEVGVPDVLGVRSGAAVPLRRAREVDGVLLVGHRAGRWTDAADVELLVAFGELTSGALRNADEHAAAQRAATLDPLTGSLNHGAFMARVHEEIARAERAGATGGLSLVLLDLDEFKAVNDRFGHLRGDAVLRRVAEALRAVGRTYDRVGRYGGDEFALLLPSTDARTARRVVDRALAALAAVPLPGGGFVSAMAGVAEWTPGEDASALVDRADLELITAKRARRRPGARDAEAHPAEERDELQLRRLATVGALGARLAHLLDQRAIADTAMRELAATLGYEHCLIVRRDADGALAVVASRTAPGTGDGAPTAGPAVGPALRRALDERRTVLEDHVRADGVRAELAVPVEVGGDLWGALVLHASDARSLDGHDARVVEGVAEHVGSALRTAELVHELDRAHLGTAAALAAALEAKDSYTAEHAASIADLAVEVGRMLGLAEDDLRELRLGAIFHDIGKIAVPDAILGKAGPLDPEEVAVIRRHPEVGEQILAPVPFLAGVRRIVRHDHERWDGGGYPDGLRGEEIPPGARIVLVVDAWHAMTSDRPYRAAMAFEEARAEILAHAGTQFDPAVVAALLRVLEPGRG